MGSVVSSVKMYFGIGNELMWRQVLERKTMTGEFGMCFPFSKHEHIDDLLWEFEVVISALSDQNAAPEMNENESKSKTGNINIDHRQTQKSEADESENRNESSLNGESTVPFDSNGGDGLRFRYRSTVNAFDIANTQEMNYDFNKKSYTEEEIIRMLPLSSYECSNLDAQTTKEDSTLSRAYREVEGCILDPRKVEELGNLFDQEGLRQNVEFIRDQIFMQEDSQGNELASNFSSAHEGEINQQEQPYPHPKFDEILSVEFDDFGGGLSPNGKTSMFEGKSQTGSSSNYREENQIELCYNYSLGVSGMGQNSNANVLEEDERGFEIKESGTYSSERPTDQSSDEDLKDSSFSDKIDSTGVDTHSYHLPTRPSVAAKAHDRENEEKRQAPNMLKKVKNKMVCCNSSSEPETYDIELHRAKVKGTDITSQRGVKSIFHEKYREVLGNTGTQEHLLDPFKDWNNLEAVYFTRGSANRLHGPTKKLGGYLGLGKSPFPKNPFKRPIMANCIKDLSRLLHRIFFPCIILFNILKSTNSPFRMFYSRSKSHEGVYLRGGAALRFYKMLVTVETKSEAGKLCTERNNLIKLYKWKHDTLIHVLSLAKDYYTKPTENNRYRWKVLKKKLLSSEHASEIDLQYISSPPPVHTPVFTFFLMLSQIIMFIIQMLTQDMQFTGVIPAEKIGFDIATMLGHETLVGYSTTNPQIGAKPTSLIEFGSVYAPCIVPKLSRITRYSQRKLTSISGGEKGCCEMIVPLKTAALTTEEQCRTLTKGRGFWTPKSNCGQKAGGEGQDVKNRSEIFRPCCYNLFGDCMMTSRKHCQFLEGVFHSECEYCHHINCFGDVCRSWLSTTPLASDKTLPWLPSEDAHWQHYRIVVSLILTPGVLHLSCLILVEFALMSSLEKSISWHRIALIYITSGINGSLAHISFEPYKLAVSSTGGAMGVIGAHIMELYHAWDQVEHPKWSAFTVLATLVVFMVTASLPLVSMVAMVTGLISGMIFGVMMIPYIAYRGLSFWRGRVVLFVCNLWLTLFGCLLNMAFQVVPKDLEFTSTHR